jgi:hypothetical protein
MGDLKRVVIKEEFVELTGDVVAAVILSQMLYWSERCRDADAFLREERDRNGQDVELRHGWIYKSAPDLAEEIMLGVSKATVQRRLAELVEAGYLDRRDSPNAWDNTYQYRPNIYLIQQELHRIGYVLDGYPLQFRFEDETHSEPSADHREPQINHGEPSMIHSEPSMIHREPSRPQREPTVPEITSETTSEITTRDHQRAGAGAGNPYLLYEQATGRPMTAFERQELQALVDDYESFRRKLPDETSGADQPGEAWIKAAIEVGGRALGARLHINYLDAILRRWQNEGYKSKMEVRNGRDDTGSAPTGAAAKANGRLRDASEQEAALFRERLAEKQKGKAGD